MKNSFFLFIPKQGRQSLYNVTKIRNVSFVQNEVYMWIKTSQLYVLCCIHSSCGSFISNIVHMDKPHVPELWTMSRKNNIHFSIENLSSPRRYEQIEI